MITIWRRALKALWVQIKSLTRTLPYLTHWGLEHKCVTQIYPDPIGSKSPTDLSSYFRGFLYNDIDRCTGCQECAVICPTQCITIERGPLLDPQRYWVRKFDIDFSKCVFCGLCTEVCAPKSLIHTKRFEGAAYAKKDLIINFGRGEHFEGQQ